MIQEYHDKPSFKCRGKSAFGLFFGVELEVEVDSDFQRAERAERVIKSLPSNFAIAKKDGSVKKGFEICSCPASLQYHSTAWDKFFEKATHGLRGFSGENCGMHVHVSRASLSSLQIGKIVV